MTSIGSDEARPNVALIVETSVVYGREILKRISRYLRVHGQWSIFLDERELDAPSPDWLYGAEGSLVGSFQTSYAYPETQRIEISGTKGRLVVDDTVRSYTFNAHGSELGETWQAGHFNDLDREFHRTFDFYIAAMLEAFKNGEEPPVHARARRRALELAQAAIRSVQTGRRVEVPN